MKVETMAKLVFEEKSFKNENGDSITYTVCTAIVSGEEIRMNVKKEDKSLLEFLLKRMVDWYGKKRKEKS